MKKYYTNSFSKKITKKRGVKKINKSKRNKVIKGGSTNLFRKYEQEGKTVKFYTKKIIAACSPYSLLAISSTTTTTNIDNLTTVLNETSYQTQPKTREEIIKIIVVKICELDSEGELIHLINDEDGNRIDDEMILSNKIARYLCNNRLPIHTETEDKENIIVWISNIVLIMLKYIQN